MGTTVTSAPRAATTAKAWSLVSMTTTVMTTAADGQRQHAGACVGHAGDHVGHVGAPHDRERVSIHCAVVDGSRRAVLRIGSGDDLASNSSKIIYS